MPSDCRTMLEVGGIGVPIEMQDVSINHGDLMYADADGVARIPRVHEAEVLDAALKRAENEASIKHAVACGMSTDYLLNNNGSF